MDNKNNSAFFSELADLLKRHNTRIMAIADYEPSYLCFDGDGVELELENGQIDYDGCMKEAMNENRDQ